MGFTALAVITGVSTVGLALLVQYVDSTLFTITVTATSLIVGPQGGVFFIGMLIPWIGWKVSPGNILTFIYSYFSFFSIRKAGINFYFSNGNDRKLR